MHEALTPGDPTPSDTTAPHCLAEKELCELSPFLPSTIFQVTNCISAPFTAPPPFYWPGQGEFFLASQDRKASILPALFHEPDQTPKKLENH